MSLKPSAVAELAIAESNAPQSQALTQTTELISKIASDLNVTCTPELMEVAATDSDAASAMLI